MLVVLPCFVRGGLPHHRLSERPGPSAADRRALVDMLAQRTGVDDPGDSQRAPEGTTSLRHGETVRIGVNVRTPARPSTGQIGYDTEDRLAGWFPARRLGTVLNRDDPQQLGGWCAAPATHTGAHRGRATYHRRSLPCMRPVWRVRPSTGPRPARSRGRTSDLTEPRPRPEPRCRVGCRCAIQSGGPRAGHFAPPGRSPARAGSRAP